MKKLLLLLLIAVVGAGISIGANAIFFSRASSDGPQGEPRGLVPDLTVTGASNRSTPQPSASPLPSPSPSPAPTAATSSSGSSGGSSGSSGTTTGSDEGPRTPRQPSGSDAQPQASTFVVQGVHDTQPTPSDPCDLEQSERDQRRCENERDRQDNGNG